MDKKICIITGANSGIGKAAAIRIARGGTHTVLACRSQAKGEAALHEVKAASESQDVELMIVDMARQSSVRDFVNAFLAKHDRLDILINNAAIFDITQRSAIYTDEGIESVWATNHLGPVLLTSQLWDALKRSEQGRVITVGSKGLLAKPFLKVDLGDPEFRKRPFRITNAYYQSKLAQLMFCSWLADHGRKHAITSNAIRVPAVQVDLAKYADLPKLMKKLYELKRRSALSPEEMAACYASVATDTQLRHTTGVYFDEKVQPVAMPRAERQAQATEQVLALTLRAIGLDAGDSQVFA